MHGEYGTGEISRPWEAVFEVDLGWLVVCSRGLGFLEVDGWIDTLLPPLLGSIVPSSK